MTLHIVLKVLVKVDLISNLFHLLCLNTCTFKVDRKQTHMDRVKKINRMTDMVRGIKPSPSDVDQLSYCAANLAPDGLSRTVIFVLEWIPSLMRTTRTPWLLFQTLVLQHLIH